MKILFLSPLPPWPLHSGGQIRVYHLLKALSLKHKITLVCYVTYDEDQGIRQELEKICEKVIVVRRRYKPWTFNALFKTLFSTKPLLMNIYDLGKELAAFSDEKDLIYCECFYLMDKIGKTSAPILLGEQNIEYIAYERYLKDMIWYKKIIMWPFAQLDLLKMKFWERKMWREADRLATVSEADRDIITHDTGRKDIVVIPNGVDTEKFEMQQTKINNKTILFIGEFKWFPNTEAVEWLVKEIFPRIKKEVADAKLLIAGRHMPAWLKFLKTEGITVDDSIEDIREAYEKATVFLAALRSGSGTKYKILEAMASGVPIVTTPVGAEGLDKSCMMVANDVSTLANATVRVLNNPKDYETLTKKARQLVENNYDWSIIGEKLEKIIEQNYNTTKC